MIHTEQERQAWHDHLKAIFQRPDPEKRVETTSGIFARTLAKRCPWCGDVFFGYQREGNETQPYQIDPDPRHGRGSRETCGNPICWASEDQHQWQRAMDYSHRKSESKATAKAEAQPVALL